MTYITYGEEDRRQYWLRIINVRTPGIKIYLYKIFLTPALTSISALLDLILRSYAIIQRGVTGADPPLRLGMRRQVSSVVKYFNLINEDYDDKF